MWVLLFRCSESCVLICLRWLWGASSGPQGPSEKTAPSPCRPWHVFQVTWGSVTPVHEGTFMALRRGHVFEAAQAGHPDRPQAPTLHETGSRGSGLAPSVIGICRFLYETLNRFMTTSFWEAVFEVTGYKMVLGSQEKLSCKIVLECRHWRW